MLAGWGCTCCTSVVVPKDTQHDQENRESLESALLEKQEALQEMEPVQEEEPPKLKKVKVDKTGKKKKKKAKKQEEPKSPKEQISSFSQSITHDTEAPAAFRDDPEPAAADPVVESKEVEAHSVKPLSVDVPAEVEVREGPKSVKFQEETIAVEAPKFDDEEPKAEDATKKRAATIEGELEPLRKGFTVKKVNPMNTRVVILWINPDGDKLNWGSKRNAVEKTLPIDEITEIEGSLEEDAAAGGPTSPVAGDGGFSDDEAPRVGRESDAGLSPRAADDEDEEGKEPLSPKTDKEKSVSTSKSKSKAPRALREFKIVAKSKTHVFRTKNTSDRIKMIKSLRAALERYQSSAMKQVLQDISSA